MAKLTISIPDAVSEYVTSRIATGRYDSPSEYFSDLVCREQRRHESVEELGAMLDESIKSGVSKSKTPEITSKVEAKMRTDGRL